MSQTYDQKCFLRFSEVAANSHGTRDLQLADIALPHSATLGNVTELNWTDMV